jgi:excisionase family DNA binding protein
VQGKSRQAERRPLLGIEEVAELLGVGVRHVRRLIADRRIPYLKWGHLLRFDPIEIEGWLDEARRPASPEVVTMQALHIRRDRSPEGARWPAAGFRVPDQAGGAGLPGAGGG